MEHDVANDERVRQHFFSEHTDAAVVSAAGAKMQNESYVAFLSMLTRWPRPSRVRQVDTPVSVVAAEHDEIFTLDEQRSLAAAYDTSLAIIDCAHDIMLDDGWPILVDNITLTLGSVNETT